MRLAPTVRLGKVAGPFFLHALMALSFEGVVEPDGPIATSQCARPYDHHRPLRGTQCQRKHVRAWLHAWRMWTSKRLVTPSRPLGPCAGGQHRAWETGGA